MIPPLDPFAQKFDSIEIDHAPSPAAIENAFAALAPTAAAPEDGQPGFFLLDDANGRFIVDREMGVIMLRNDALLTNEANAVYPVRLRVVELSGASYDLDLKLRITGRVPQVLGEDFGFGLETMRTHAKPAVAWTAFSPAQGAQTKCALELTGPYGALLGAVTPVTNESVSIGFSERLPLCAPSHAPWSL